MKKLFIAVALSAGVIGGAAAPALASPISTHQAAKQYLADVAPANTALAAFDKAVTKWTKSDGTAAQTNPFVKPCVAALNRVDNQLTEQRWPANTTADMHALIVAIAAVEGDIAGLPSLNLLSVSSWVAAFTRDATVERAAVNTVRHDLHLPPSHPAASQS